MQPKLGLHNIVSRRLPNSFSYYRPRGHEEVITLKELQAANPLVNSATYTEVFILMELKEYIKMEKQKSHSSLPPSSVPGFHVLKYFQWILRLEWMSRSNAIEQHGQGNKLSLQVGNCLGTSIVNLLLLPTFSLYIAHAFI